MCVLVWGEGYHSFIFNLGRGIEKRGGEAIFLQNIPK